MVCKKCGAQLSIKDDSLEGKCGFCGRAFVVKSKEESQLDEMIESRKLTLKDFDARLRKKRDEVDLLKRTVNMAIKIIIVFVVFILSWHFGSERSFKRNQVALIFTSVLVVPGFVVGYLGGIVLAFKFAQITTRSPQAVILFAICTLNVYSVCIAIYSLIKTPYFKAKKELAVIEKEREEHQQALNELNEKLKQISST